MLRLKNARLKSARLAISAVALCLVAVVGCTGDMANWDWFGMKKKENERPQTRTAADSNRARSTDSKTAATAKPNPDDAKARQVDEKVEQYVSTMNPRYSSGYESNDFNSKIRRQEDPNRNARIQQTATRHRNGDTGPDRTLTNETDASTPPAREPATVGSNPPPADARQADDRMDGGPRLADPADGDDPLLKTQTPADVGMSERSATPGRTSDSKPPSDKSTPDYSANKPVAPAKTTSEAEASDVLENDVAAGDAPNESGENGSHEAQRGKRPPVITEMSVEASDKSSATEVADSTPPAEKSASLSPAKEPIIVDTFKKRITEQEAKVAADPNNVEEQFRLRILYMADGQDEKALAASDGINADVLEIMRAQLSALMTARSSAQRDPATWANRQIEAIEKLRTLVAERADLRVSKVVICRSISQFGQYEPINPAVFKVGAESKFLLYVPIENFKCERTESGQFRTLLSIRFSLIDGNGVEKWTDKVENVEDISRDRRSDFFFGWPERGLPIPMQLGEGEYTIKVEVEDVLAQKINSNVAKFKLEP